MPGTVAQHMPARFTKAFAGEANVIEITHDPSGRRIRIALTPDRDAEGAVIGVFILSTDVTHEAQARAALAQASKRELAAKLSSGLAHDFANLLTIILGLQGRLERMEDLAPEAHEAIRATLAAARRGGTLLDRIAAISGPRELRPEAVILSDLLDDLDVSRDRGWFRLRCARRTGILSESGSSK